MTSIVASIQPSFAAPGPAGKAGAPRGRLWLYLATGFWLGLLVTALVWMANYSATPGAAAVTPTVWPEHTRLQRNPDHPTLLLFAHPRCPCTRATIGELARLAANSHGRFTAQVWFNQPAEVPANWERTDIWQAAAEIPGVTVHVDAGSREAARFRAQTSGHAMLYAPDGKLLFQGGLTIARGHSGDNPGRAALENLLRDQNVPVRATPVFGCELFSTPLTCEEARCNL